MDGYFISLKTIPRNGHYAESQVDRFHYFTASRISSSIYYILYFSVCLQWKS